MVRRFEDSEKKRFHECTSAVPVFAFFFLTVPLRCAFEKLESRMYGGRTDFCGRTHGRTHAQTSAASEGTPAPPKIHRTLTIVVHLAVILGSEVVR